MRRDFGISYRPLGPNECTTRGRRGIGDRSLVDGARSAGGVVVCRLYRDIAAVGRGDRCALDFRAYGRADLRRRLGQPGPDPPRDRDAERIGLGRTFRVGGDIDVSAHIDGAIPNDGLDGWRRSGGRHGTASAEQYAARGRCGLCISCALADTLNLEGRRARNRTVETAVYRPVCVAFGKAQADAKTAYCQTLRFRLGDFRGLGRQLDPGSCGHLGAETGRGGDIRRIRGDRKGTRSGDETARTGSRMRFRLLVFTGIMAGAHIHCTSGAVDFRVCAKACYHRRRERGMSYRCHDRTKAADCYAEDFRFGLHVSLGFDRYIAAGLYICPGADFSLDGRRDIDEREIHAACDCSNADAKGLAFSIDGGVGIHVHCANNLGTLTNLCVVSNVGSGLIRSGIADRDFGKGRADCTGT